MTKQKPQMGCSRKTGKQRAEEDGLWKQRSEFQSHLCHLQPCDKSERPGPHSPSLGTPLCCLDCVAYCYIKYLASTKQLLLTSPPSPPWTGGQEQMRKESELRHQARSLICGAKSRSPKKSERRTTSTQPRRSQPIKCQSLWA